MNFLSLPTVQAPQNALANFAPITDAIDGNRRNALMQQDNARQNQELKMRGDEVTYQRGRDAKNDHYAQIKRGADMAMAIQNLPDNDPAKPMAWKRYLQTYGDGSHSPEELDHVTGPKIAAAAAGQFLDPRTSQMKDLEMQKTRAEIGKLQRDAEGSNKYGLVPVYGRDAQGNIVVMQPGHNGELVQSKMPSGVTIDLGVKSFDSAQAKERGEAQGKAAFNMPTVERNTSKLISNIDSVLTDPYLANMTGPIAGRLPNLTADANRVQSKMDQVQGQTFLQAFNDLRGGGAITEAEGSKATQSYNRLANTRVGTQDYVKALNEFKNDVLELQDIARRKAGFQSAAPAQSAPAEPAPATAPISGFKYIGPAQ